MSLLSTLDSSGYYKKQHRGTACVNNCRVLTIVVEDVFKLSVFLQNVFSLVSQFIAIKDMN